MFIQQSSDYRLDFKLGQHTDHASYQGTPGYTQIMLQAKGSVTTTICDGFKIAEDLRHNSPHHFRLLTQCLVTHGFCNRLYTRIGGLPRKPSWLENDDPLPRSFDVVQTHPVIKVDEEGSVLQIIHSEQKRGICTIPFDVYKSFMKAYREWCLLCESPKYKATVDWPEGSFLIFNNTRMLHGRALLRTGVVGNEDRFMVGSYWNKPTFLNRYRFLKRQQISMQGGLSQRWTDRMSNQLVASLVLSTELEKKDNDEGMSA